MTTTENSRTDALTDEAEEAWIAYLDREKYVLGMPGLQSRQAFKAGFAAGRACPSSQPAGALCKTCDGRGEVGGWRAGEGYDSEPCPDCTPAPSPADERAAFEAKFPVPNGIKWDGEKYVVCDGYENSYRADRFVGQWAAWQARAASANETGAEGVAHAPAGYGLTAEQLATLQSNGLKPEEIGGDVPMQHDRVRELVHWFARFARGEANPKWAHAHAFELAYFIASNGQNRHIDLREIADKAYLEGVNISASDRGILERLGKIAPQPAQADALDVPADDLVGFVYVLENPDRPHDPVTRFSRRPRGVKSFGAKIRSVTPVYSRPEQTDARVGLTDGDRAVLTHAADFLEQRHSRIAAVALRALLQGANHA